MAWTRFNTIVLIQVLLIALVGMLVTISFGREYMHMTTAGLILVWAGQIAFLNFYLNRIHRDVRKFMDALKNQETTRFFSSRKEGRYFKRLYASFNEITRNFRLVRIEKEVENHFFRETIMQSASGMMAVSEDGNIGLINSAGLLILGMESLKNLSELKEIHPGLAEMFFSGEVKDHNHVKILVNKKMVQLAVKVKEMNLQGSPVRIYSLLDITREMARNEVEAWQKLIRVLNHEITNSVTPIHILSTSLFELFHDGNRQKSAGEIDEELMKRTILGLKTITKRSGGLADFLNTYRSFAKTGEPEYSTVNVSAMLHHILSLLADDIDHAGVEITMDVTPQGLEILADEKLIEQTLINLVKNSIQALEGVKNPVIGLKAFSPDQQVFPDQQVSIEITDNGKGISEEILDHVFTPFFTTRKDGSGIGLSLARQVMQMHNGSIHVNSREGKHTTFTLSF